MRGRWVHGPGGRENGEAQVPGSDQRKVPTEKSSDRKKFRPEKVPTGKSSDGKSSDRKKFRPEKFRSGKSSDQEKVPTRKKVPTGKKFRPGRKGKRHIYSNIDKIENNSDSKGNSNRKE